MNKSHKIYMIEHLERKFKPYVGRTNRKLYDRIERHIKRAKKKLYGNKEMTERDEMIIYSMLHNQKLRVKLLITGIRNLDEIIFIESCLIHEIGLENLSNVHPGDGLSLENKGNKKKCNVGFTENKRRLYILGLTNISKRVMSQKTKDKISKTKKEYYKTHDHWLKGKHHTEEAKQKMSKTNKEHYKNHNTWMKGKTHSSESKQKMSEAHKEHNKVYGYKSPTKGKHYTKETREKMSESQRKRRSEERVLIDFKQSIKELRRIMK